MAENPYQSGKLNIPGTAEIKAIHPAPQSAEKPVVMTGTDLRGGKGSK